MNERRDPDRLVHDFLMEGQTELADQVYDAVRATIEQKPQRVVIGPWRMPNHEQARAHRPRRRRRGRGPRRRYPVPRSARAGRRRGGGHAVSPRPTASPTPSRRSPRHRRRRMAAPPLTETLHLADAWHHRVVPRGLDRVDAATEPWTDGTRPADFIRPVRDDRCHDPVADGRPVLVDRVAADRRFHARRVGRRADRRLATGCTATEPIAVDGATGLIGADDCTAAAVTTDGRGYWIWLRAAATIASRRRSYDRAWFEEVLATVQLQPEDAVDVAPSASP